MKPRKILAIVVLFVVVVLTAACQKCTNVVQQVTVVMPQPTPVYLSPASEDDAQFAILSSSNIADADQLKGWYGEGYIPVSDLWKVYKGHSLSGINPCPGDENPKLGKLWQMAYKNNMANSVILYVTSDPGRFAVLDAITHQGEMYEHSAHDEVVLLRPGQQFCADVGEINPNNGHYNIWMEVKDATVLDQMPWLQQKYVLSQVARYLVLQDTRYLHFYRIDGVEVNIP